MRRTPITHRGAERLRTELKTLKTIERPRITKAIAEARAHGDLSENAEYHAAREEQGFVEGRIRALETTLADAEIVNVVKVNAGDRIVFGATVELLNLANEQRVSYQIVGEEEADLASGLVSILSPIARALIGREVGDIAEVNAPAGTLQYEILSVRYI